MSAKLVGTFNVRANPNSPEFHHYTSLVREGRQMGLNLGLTKLTSDLPKGKQLDRHVFVCIAAFLRARSVASSRVSGRSSNQITTKPQCELPHHRLTLIRSDLASTLHCLTLWHALPALQVRSCPIANRLRHRVRASIHDLLPCLQGPSLVEAKRSVG